MVIPALASSSIDASKHWRRLSKTGPIWWSVLSKACCTSGSKPPTQALSLTVFPTEQRIPGGEAVQDFAKWLSEEPFNEADYWLATAYAILVGDEVRTERALYFTPPLLAERVIDNLLQHGASLTTHRWHDPPAAAQRSSCRSRSECLLRWQRPTCPAAQKLAHTSRAISAATTWIQLFSRSPREFLRMALLIW